MISNPIIRYQTVLDALRFHVETRGDATAYTFLKSDDERSSVSYREVDQSARRIAVGLLQQAEPGDRAILMYPSGLDFIEAFLGCLYAGIVAVPAYPPKKNRNAERILTIAEDCTPRLLLCKSETKPNVDGEFSASVPGAKVVFTDEIARSTEGTLPRIYSDQLAFLQYTSGSTAAPKGVCISHQNLVANEAMIQEAFGHDRNSVVCGWLPAFHDMGLIGIVLQPLWVGIHAILMSPIRFLSKPVRWFQAIDEFQVTTTGGPNFCYEHCMNLINPSELDGISLSSWRVAFNGAEPVRKKTLDKFAMAYRAVGFSASSFLPCYGMAEATLIVSGGPQGKLPRVSFVQKADDRNSPAEYDDCQVVSCGRVSIGTEVKIVDPVTLHPARERQVGEIWVRGKSVASGYWGKGIASNDFAAVYKTQGDNAPYFRTGDLGFLEGDELFVTGRLKDLIIIHGRNIYPHDIEIIAEDKLGGAAANSAAAFSVWANGEERLCIVMEAPRTWGLKARRGELSELDSKRLTSILSNIRHDVAAKLNVRAEYFGFLPAGKFPRTSSGKVQRRVCKAAIQNGTLPFLDFPGCVTSLKKASDGRAPLGQHS